MTKWINDSKQFYPHSPETLCCVAHLIKSVRIVQKVICETHMCASLCKYGSRSRSEVMYLRSHYDNENAWRHLNLNIPKQNWTDFFLKLVLKIWRACGAPSRKYGAAKKVGASNAPPPASRGLKWVSTGWYFWLHGFPYSHHSGTFCSFSTLKA